MKNRVSSILFAFAIFGGGMAQAEDFTPVKATITFDLAKLDTETGAAEVMKDIERQAKAACRKVSLVSVGLVIDEVCAQDVAYQAVEKISHDNLTAQYAASDYFVDGVSDRIVLASN